jgi:hypothetical protein
MVPALATTGRTAAPKTERAAAERKALREVGSAFMTTELLWTWVEGAKAATTAKEERRAKMTFIFGYFCGKMDPKTDYR